MDTKLSIIDEALQMHIGIMFLEGYTRGEIRRTLYEYKIHEPEFERAERLLKKLIGIKNLNLERYAKEYLQGIFYAWYTDTPLTPNQVWFKADKRHSMYLLCMERITIWKLSKKKPSLRENKPK